MDTRRIRLYQLAKQNLAAKAPAGSYRRLLRDHLGLHSTDYLTPYLSLQARVRDFEPRALFDDLNRTRKAVRLRAFRGTVFIVHRDNLALIQAGAHHFYASTMAQIEKLACQDGLDLKPLEKKVAGLLAGRKRMTALQLNRELRTGLKPGLPPFFLRYLEFKGLLVRVGQKHLDDHVIPYGLLRDWFPEASAETIDPGRALQEIVRRYIAKFGPVCLDDICWWLPISKTAGKTTVEGLKDELAFFDLNGREYMMDRADFRRFQRFKSGSDEPCLNFLPYEDHFPKAFAVRDWFLSAEAESLLFQKGVTELGQIRPSIWLDGEVIGRWEFQPAGQAGRSTKVKIISLVRPSRFSKKVLSGIEDRRRELELFIDTKIAPLRTKEEKP